MGYFLSLVVLRQISFDAKPASTRQWSDSEKISSCLDAIFEESGSNLFFNVVTAKKKVLVVLFGSQNIFAPRTNIQISFKVRVPTIFGPEDLAAKTTSNGDGRAP